MLKYSSTPNKIAKTAVLYALATVITILSNVIMH